MSSMIDSPFFALVRVILSFSILAEGQIHSLRPFADSSLLVELRAGHSSSIWEPVTLPANVSNPCENDATLLYNAIRNSYACECPVGFGGRNCQTRTRICEEMNDPCEAYSPNPSSKIECRAVQGNGFLCDRLPHRERWCPDFRRIEESPCPKGWTCLEHLAGGDENFRCLPPGEISPPAPTPSGFVKFPAGYDCQNGGWRDSDGPCICLQHFTGPLCETVVDYCRSNPCPGSCVSFLGGYTCRCPEFRTGPYCGEIKRRAIGTTRTPYFFYEANQYVSVSSVYLYCVQELGVLSSVVVNFGDGITTKIAREDFKRIDGLNDLLISLQYEPVQWEETTVLAVEKSHAYREEGIYVISLEAWDNNLLVLELNVTVRVSDPSKCALEVDLRNSARSSDNATVFRRRDGINVYATSTTTCTSPRLEFDWQLYAVSSFSSAEASQIRRSSPFETFTNTSEYHVKPFALPLGNYLLTLTVTMTRPVKGRNVTAITQFRIVSDKIVPHISGGTAFYVHDSESFEISALRSYDWNALPSTFLDFKWYCSVESPEYAISNFCEGDARSISARPILEVQETFVRRMRIGGVYKFRVAVKGVTANEKSAVRSVRIKVVPADVKLVRIECAQNCLGNTVVHSEPVALRARYSDDENAMDVRWQCNHESDSRISPLTSEDYTTNGDHFLIKANRLMPGQRYKITVTVSNAEMSNGRPGMAVLEFVTVSKFIAGTCTVTPSQGYALTTLFSISCHNFFTYNLPVTYEAFQYLIPNEDPTMIGFGISPDLPNVALAAGLPEVDYVTQLTIYVTDSTGISESYSRNVSVFPAGARADFDYEMTIVKAMTLGTNSAIARDIAEGDVPSVIQLITTLSRSLRQLFGQKAEKLRKKREFGQELDETSMERETLEDANRIKHIMVEYLSRCDFDSPIVIKYALFALKSILEIEVTDTRSRYNARALMVLDKILTELDDEYISRTDMLDIGIGLLSSASRLTKSASFFGVPRDTSIFLDSKEQEQLLIRQSETAIDGIKKYASALSNLMAPYENLEVTNTAKDIRLFIQKTVTGAEAIKISDYVEANVTLLNEYDAEDHSYSLEVIYFKNNPYRSNDDCERIDFPVVSIDVYDTYPFRRAVEKKAIINSVHLKLTMPESVKYEVVEGTVRLLPVSAYSDWDIAIHKLDVRRGGTLVLTFDDRRDDVLLRVVLKKYYRPIAEDFFDAEVVPRYSDENATDLEKRSIYVDDHDDAIDDGEHSFYYVGILPHQITVRSLLSNVDPAIPDQFLYDNPPPKPSESVGNESIAYSFKAYRAQCLRWNETEKKWEGHCRVVRREITESSLGCACRGLSTVTASFGKVAYRESPHVRLSMYVQFPENHLVSWFVVYAIVCFLASYAYAASRDRWDRQCQKIIPLEDNDENDRYCYILTVYTGRNADAGTTSRVAVVLEGTRGSSDVHVLQSSRRRVMTRGGRDHFLVRAPGSLGDVFCLHFWHDHRGSKPTWYVSRIVVHDVQTNFVSLFLIESWLTPLHRDGSMGLSCYRMFDFESPSWRTRFKIALEEAVDAGHHGWLSALSRGPALRYTRRRRVVVAFTHACLLMACVTAFYAIDEPESPSGRTHTTEEISYGWEELIVGILSALMAFPINCTLYWITRNVAPAQSYASDHSSRYVSEIIVDLPSSNVVPGISGERRLSAKEELQLNELYTGHSRPAAIKHTVPLRWPENHQENVVYDEIIRKTNPTTGTQRLRRDFVFPHTFLYPVWTLLGMILLVSLYFVLSRSSFYSWTTGLRYLLATWAALLCSFAVLEMLKLVVVSLWIMAKNKSTFVFEDRSPIVLYILRDTIPIVRARMRSLSIYKPPSIYNPIPRDRLSTLGQSTLKSLRAKTLQTTLIMTIVFVGCTYLMIINIYGYGVFYHHRNVRVLSTGEGLFDETALTSVKYMEDFVGYVETTYLKYLYYEKSDGEVVTRTKDDVNYLVGPSRARQVRLHPNSCNNDPSKISYADCKYADIRYDSDDRNFGESWGELTDDPGSRVEDGSWLFNDIDTTGAEGYIVGNESSYPKGGYIALFGQDKEKMSSMLSYLKRTKWFDKYTRAIILESSLFNPNTKVASSLVILGERCYNGGFAIYRNIFSVTIRSMEDHKEILLLMFVIALAVALILSSIKETRELLASPKKYLSQTWNVLSALLIFCGMATTMAYVYRTRKVYLAIEKLKNSNREKFVAFYEEAKAQRVFLLLTACTNAIAIVRLSHTVIASPKMYPLWKSLLTAAKFMIGATILILILLVGSAWLIFLTYGSASWNYHRLDVAILNLLRMKPASRDLIALPTLNTCISTRIAQLVLGGFFLCFYLVFRLLPIAVIINSYDETRSLMRKYPLEDVEDLHATTGRNIRDTKRGSLGIRIVDLTPARRFAMHRILRNFISERFATDGSLERKIDRRKRSSKSDRAQSMAAIMIDTFNNYRRVHPPPSEVETVEAHRALLMTTVLATSLQLKRISKRLHRLDKVLKNPGLEETREPAR